MTLFNEKPHHAFFIYQNPASITYNNLSGQQKQALNTIQGHIFPFLVIRSCKCCMWHTHTYTYTYKALLKSNGTEDLGWSFSVGSSLWATSFTGSHCHLIHCCDLRGSQSLGALSVVVMGWKRFETGMWYVNIYFLRLIRKDKHPYFPQMTPETTSSCKAVTLHVTV